MTACRARSRSSCWRWPSSMISAPSSLSPCSTPTTCRGCRWRWPAPVSPCSGSSNRRGVTRLAPYLLTGVVIWICVLKSGVHATLAGVVVAFAIPLHEPQRGRAVAARAARGEPAPLGRVRRPAAVRVRQRGRLAAGPVAGEAAGAGPARHRARPVHRQAARHLRRQLAGHQERACRQAGRCVVGCSCSASACWAASVSP